MAHGWLVLTLTDSALVLGLVVGSFANAYLVGSAAALLGAGAATFVRSRAGRRAQVPLRRSSP